MSGRRFLTALVVAAWCAVAAPALADTQDGLGLPLAAVRFECDAWIDGAGLRELLPLLPGEPVTQEGIDASTRVLEQTKIFTAIAPEVQALDGGAVVVFHLTRKQIVTDVSVHGYDELRWRDVYRLLRVRTGSFYDPEAVEAARQRLITRYQQIGYPRATVEQGMTELPGAVDLWFQIDEGKPLRVAAVVISGDTGIPSEELDEAVKSFVGKPIRRESPRQGTRLIQTRLRQDGYFDAEVDGEWVQTSDDEGVLWFTVDAGVATEITFIGNESCDRGDVFGYELGWCSPKQLLGLMEIDTRLIITDGTWRELARRIKRLFEQRGYYRATVDVEIEDGTPRRVTYTIDQGRQYEVRQVRFVGNKQLDSDELRDEMNTQPARTLPWPRRGAFVRAVFEEDLRRLWYFYREQAFASAEIVDAPIEVDDETGAIIVTVVIDEGPRTIVEAVRPPDLDELPADKRELTLQLTPGEPLLPAQLERDTEAVRKALRSDGYIGAQVTPAMTERPEGDTVQAVVAWTIEPGTRHTIGQVLVQGNVETRNQVVLDKLPFKSGDPLDPELLRQGQDQVYRLGTYRSVSVQALRPDGSEVHDITAELQDNAGDEAPADVPAVQDVGVEVVPRPPGSIQWGVGYNTRDGITGFGLSSL